MLAKTIGSYLHAHRAEHLAQLKEFLRFESISAQSSHHDDCLACATWVARQLEALDLTAEVDRTPARPAVLAESRQLPDRSTLLVYGHYDVQPPDPLELWRIS